MQPQRHGDGGFAVYTPAVAAVGTLRCKCPWRRRTEARTPADAVAHEVRSAECSGAHHLLQLPPGEPIPLRRLPGQPLGCVLRLAHRNLGLRASHCAAATISLHTIIVMSSTSQEAACCTSEDRWRGDLAIW